MSLEIIKDARERSAFWLRDNQAADGGWPERLGTRTNVLNTAEAIIALIESKVCQAGDASIQKAAGYLTAHQLTSGQDSGALVREVEEGGSTRKIPDIIRTCVSIEALIAAGRVAEAKAAIDWLIAIEQLDPDGGWAYRRGSTSGSKLVPTCFALRAIIRAYSASSEEYRSIWKPIIQKGLKRLIKWGCADGSFGDEELYRGLHTALAALTLQTAERSDLSLYARQEKLALDWLLANQSDARRIAEALVEIDPHRRPDDSGAGDYNFAFLTDELIIRLLYGSSQESYRTSRLANDALCSLQEQINPKGGVYGYRIFSWSTARLVSALSTIDHGIVKFPKRKPEYPAPPAGGRIVFWFAVVLVVASVTVIFVLLNDPVTLGIVEAFFVFLMLALLLADRRINAKTFSELTGSILGLLGASKKSTEDSA